MWALKGPRLSQDRERVLHIFTCGVTELRIEAFNPDKSVNLLNTVLKRLFCRVLSNSSRSTSGTDGGGRVVLRDRPAVYTR